MRHGMVLLLLFLPFAAFAQGPEPELVTGSLELHKTALAISYNPLHKQADWVFYSLGPDELRNCTGRKNNFAPDPQLSREDSAELSDYSGSGFDRGHLSPAADNKFSTQAMRESFYLSNISPQPPRFNQGIWAQLENLVRAWALKEGGIWVATGPVLAEGLPVIGRGVSTPQAYYKVIATKDPRDRKVLALLLPVNASGSLARYATTVDEVEASASLNFLPGLAEERRLESELHPEAWDFGARYAPLPCQGQGIQAPWADFIPW